MREIQICILAICIIGLIPQFAECATETIFATLTNETPSNFYKSPFLTSTDKWKLVLTWSGAASINTPTVKQVVNGVESNYDLTGVQPSGGTAGSGYYIAEKLSKIDGYLIVNLGFSDFVTVYGQFFINGVLVKAQTGIFYKNQHIPINQITITSACRLKIKVNGITPTPKIGVYLTTVGTSNPDFQSSTGELIIDFVKNGTYYIGVFPNSYTLPIVSTPTALTGTITPFSLTLYTYCDKFCASPAFPTAPACTTCGNAILQAGEQCDNGNKAGCKNCFVAAGYTCYGNPGGSSLCTKTPVCGDSIIDQGEQCDNGNKVGCTSSCVPDNGYKCSAVLGTASLCGFCGNGIVEPGEECDNKGLAGCSVGCKVDAGFICKGASSFCSRRNPSCGNGVIEVAESCDDGNLANGDGCSQYCLVEKDYTCSGQFGDLSKCQKNAVTGPVCGNKVKETGEQCDNGKHAGCTDCKIESGYTCVSRPALPSICLPTVSNCGNGVTEPLKGEVCDDGNRNSGDGCSSLCRVEQGWVCTDKCIMVGDPRIKAIFCGNGKLEVHYGELCDDGNTADNDGCNQNCRVENGWSCRILTYAENKSYCTSTAGLSYCGNGIVEGNETCDDGFPVKSGDGCSARCQVESGYDCSTGVCRPI